MILKGDNLKKSEMNLRENKK